MWTTDRIRLGHFYMRRLLRLAPALLVAVALTALFMIATRDPQLPDYWEQAAAAVSYTSDFFMAGGAQMPILGHTWSLAVEEQFYLLWPVLLIGVLTVARTRIQATWIVGVAAAIFFVWRLTAPLVFDGWERTYFAPDTVFYALLCGCVLALVPGNLKSLPLWWGYVSLGSLAVLSAIPSISFEGVDRIITLYIGAFAAAFALIVVALSTRMKVLEFRPLIFLGTVSYGWYIWHQIVLHLEPFGKSISGSAAHAGLAMFALLLAWLSFRYVESPVLRVKRRFEISQPNADQVSKESRAGV